ncbi:Nup50 family protein [Megaselia abdita]
MAGKRSAGYDLNADNWDKDEEPEERGVFQTASQDELKTRVIKRARRKMQGSANDSEQKSGAFSSFSGFGKSNSAATTLSAASSSPFSFLSKMSSVTSVASTSSFTTSIASTTSKDNNTVNKTVSTSKNVDNKYNNEDYHTKLKGLNLAVMEWIRSHLDKNPLVILSPIFQDYDNHLDEIQKSNISKEKIQILSDFKFNSTESKPAVDQSKNSVYPFRSSLSNAEEQCSEKTDKPLSTFGTKTADDTTSTALLGIKKNDKSLDSTFTFVNKDPDNTSKSFSFGAKPIENIENKNVSFSKKSPEEFKSNFLFGTKPPVNEPNVSFSFQSASEKKVEALKPALSFGAGISAATSAGFSFTGAKPFSFSGVTPTSTPAVANEEDEENDEPPKVEFTKVEENDSVYSIKCKVFVKNEDQFGDRGVGTLHLKPVEGQKKTQLIVRADTNLGNLLLNMLLNESVPTKRMGKKDVLLVAVPMPTDKKPSQILVRVKTEDEADKLLETLEKQKNPE